MRRVEELLGTLDRRTMCPRPFSNRAQGLTQGSAQSRKLVVDPRRYGRIQGTRHEPIALQSPQGQRQHPLRDAVNCAAKLVKAHRTVPEQLDYQHSPFVSDTRERLAHRPAVAGIALLTRFQKCALV